MRKLVCDEPKNMISERKKIVSGMILAGFSSYYSAFSNRREMSFPRETVRNETRISIVEIHFNLILNSSSYILQFEYFNKDAIF